MTWFLDKFHGKMELMPIDIPLENAEKGFKRWDDERFDDQIELTRRILPNSYMEAFFVAKFKKIAC